MIIAAAIFMVAGKRKALQQVTYDTVPVEKGDVAYFVTATGTIEPVTEVEVGTQVSGIIAKLYADYNSTVKEGQIIAEMDKVTTMGTGPNTYIRKRTMPEARDCMRRTS